jgi:nucleoside-diphosphate-sugar epimerase
MKIKGRSYLVTGGTGFIGSNLVKALVRAGARVRLLDDDSRGSRNRLEGVARDVEIVTGDIRNPVAVMAAARGMDSVCHLAYVNGTEFFYTKPDLVLEVAVKGMINVLDACLRHDVPELVLASSSEVYQTPPRIPTDESAPLSVPDVLNPRYSYGGGKIICELMAINYGRRRIPRVVIFRPHNVYGPNMGWEHVIPQLAVRMAELHRSQPPGRIPFPIQGSGRETRAFIFIDDMIAGILCLLRKGERLGIYHIGNDQQETTIAGLAKAVAGYYHRQITVVPGELRSGGTLRRCPDISKIRALGFAPRVSLADGLEVTLEWYDRHYHERPAVPSNHSRKNRKG